MGEEAQFRNAAWGGFNKEDVLRYIEMMKQSALETNMKLDQATRQLQEAQRRVQVLEAQLKQKTEEASRLAADGQAHQARLQQAQEQVRRLDARLSSYDADKSKLQAVETQIGSLMVSAHMYSNRIISQAKQEAERITQQASLAIDQATNHINILSVDAESAQGRYQSLFNEVSAKIQALSSSLQEAGEQLQANIRRNVAEAEQALRAEAPPPEDAHASDLPVSDPVRPEGAVEPELEEMQQQAEAVPQESAPEPHREDKPVPPQQSPREPDSGIDYSRFIDVISNESMFSEE